MGALLEHEISAPGGTKTFGELTLNEVGERAQTLRGATGLGHGNRVGPVAMAWGQLAKLMEEEGAATVADLGEDAVAPHAEKLWIVPPGGSLLP